MARIFRTLALLLTGAALWVSADLPAGGLKVGDTAPDFRLKNVDGKMVSLKDYKKAKGFIVTFTCNTCPYAVMYEDRLIELNQKMASKGYPLIAVQPNDPEMSSGDSYAKMQKRAKDKQFDFPYLLDEGQKVFPQYGATRTPHIFLLDKSLKVRYIGALDDNPQDAAAVTRKYVEEAIAAIEAGKEPETTMTKAIGCSIKFKKGSM